MLMPSRRNVLKTLAGGAVLYGTKADAVLRGGVAPLPAAYWGFNHLAFNDDFTSLSTIDVNATGNPGYLWYPQSIKNQKTTHPGDIAIANSILTLTGSVDDNVFPYGYKCRLSTRGAVGTGNSVGYPTFSGGMYIECSFAAGTNHSSDAQTTGWPAFWMQDLNGLYAQQYNGTAALNFAEVDGPEFYPQSGTTTIKILGGNHDWTTTIGGNVGTSNANTNDANWDYVAAGIVPTNQNVWGLLMVPMARNNGVGLIQRYVNGTHISALDVSYTATGPASPGASPSNPNGTFANTDTGNYVMMIQTGYNWPCAFDFFRIWQT